MAQINARSETAATKPMFRAGFKKRRCLILANGYYEWEKTSKPKQPYYYRMKDETPFTFAGLWETWHGDDKPLETCAILTTDANELAMEVHDRMPVILTADDALAWLDPAIDAAALQGLLPPFPSQQMICNPVSVAVGNVRNNNASLIETVMV
jgi:putative SOS response-associated peptidase YedK